MQPGAPKCRWLLGSLTVDIMPTEGAALGLNTAWFAEALASSSLQTVAHSEFRLISPVAFLATKFTAFLDRGDRDYYGSHDLEDFITVIDGRDDIVAEVDRASLGLRRFVITSIQQLLADPNSAMLCPDICRRKRKTGLFSSAANSKALLPLPCLRIEGFYESPARLMAGEGQPSHCYLSR